MKKLTILVLILLPLPALAQNFPGMNMNGQDMQNMMLQVQKAQACMEQIDQGRLQALAEEAKRFDEEIRSLCAAGKRDLAEKKAIAYGKKMAANPLLGEMKKCTEMMQGMMPEMMSNMMPDVEPEVMKDQDSTSPRHICDSL